MMGKRSRITEEQAPNPETDEAVQLEQDAEVEQEDEVGQDTEVEEQDEAAGEDGQDEDDSEGGEEAPRTAKSDSDDEGELQVTIGDEVVTTGEDETAPGWVRELRKTNRQTAKENRELKARLAALEKTETQAPVALGKKPTLDDADYDTDKFEAELEAWYNRKREIESRTEAAKAAEQQQQAAWNEQLKSYGVARESLKFKDFDEAEDTVMNTLNQTQQGIVIQGAENPALVVYALGKNYERAKTLAAIKDPVKFAFAVAKLEKDMKVGRKAPPPPEKSVSGTGPKSGAVDSTLDRLRADAERTGNYSKVHEYRKQRRTAKA